jgi:hypothetical protein
MHSRFGNRFSRIEGQFRLGECIFLPHASQTSLLDADQPFSASGLAGRHASSPHSQNSATKQVAVARGLASFETGRGEPEEL